VTLQRPRLAFVSPNFLFPNDTGGRIRTTNILRGLKGGAFELTLISPATAAQHSEWARQLDGVSDRFIAWQPATVPPAWVRALGLWRSLPVNVQSDRTAAGMVAVSRALRESAFDVVVFDFVHAAVLRPATVSAATVCFTHNVEAEIFARHVKQAGNALTRAVWSSQHAKMLRFEREALRDFDAVVAVSERDAAFFRDSFGLPTVATIPTGVDFEYFAWHEPPPVDAAHPPTVVFTGSMDWAANIDGIRFFLAEVWPRVVAARPDACFTIVGRKPPSALIEQARTQPGVTCTGFVDDVRPYVRAAHAFVIPLRVGGGTRIKAFEAMAMGCPVVSTAIGIEGLDITPDEHFLLRDTADDQARAVLELFDDAPLRRRLARQARQCVEARFGHRVAAQAFEDICLRALRSRRPERALAEPAR
jgi:glycosyltransferase involved in cell wall biosynthesis